MQRLSKRDLQALYSEQSKIAIEYLRSSVKIAHEISSETFEEELKAQFNCNTGPINRPTIRPKCNLAADKANRTFELAEMKKDLKHWESVPCPLDWTDKQLSQNIRFARICWTGKIKMDAQKSINFMEFLLVAPLFSKTAKYQPGDDKLLKIFRPNALANVSFKLLTSILASRLSKWLEVNKSIAWSQLAILNRNGVIDQSFFINSALQYTKLGTFFDLSDAFNIICNQILTKRIRDSGFPVWIVRIVQNLYNCCVLFHS